MKTIIIYLGNKRSGGFLSKFIVLCVCVIFFTGCKKDETTLVIPVVNPLVGDSVQIVKFVPVPSTVVSGVTTVLTWKILNATSVSLITENGDTVKNLPVEGTYTTSPLLVNATFSCIAYGKGNAKIAKVAVSVTATPSLIFSVAYDSTSLKYKSTTRVSWLAVNANSVLLNGVSVGDSSHVYLNSLTKDTIIHFRVYGTKDSIKKSITIKVALPDNNYYLTFQGLGWNEYKEESGFSMDSLSVWVIPANEQRWVTYFYNNGFMEIFDTTTSLLQGNGNWNWIDGSNQTQINWAGGYVRTLISINMNRMILYFTEYGFPTRYVKMYYKR